MSLAVRNLKVLSHDDGQGDDDDDEDDGDVDVADDDVDDHFVKGSVG